MINRDLLSTTEYGEAPFQVAIIEHSKLDLVLIDSITGEPLGEPWITSMLDTYSRRVLAFHISIGQPSSVSTLAVLRECVRRFNTLPNVIITDNSPEFGAAYFTSLLEQYGVILKRRPQHKAKFGSVTERLFGTVSSQMIHEQVSSTKTVKNVSQDTKSANKNTVSLPILYEMLRTKFYEIYDTTLQPTLGETPRQMFERGLGISGKRLFRFIPYDLQFIIKTLPKVKNGTAKVDPKLGVKVNHIYYYCDEFLKPNIAETQVQVHYDPLDLSIVYCYVEGQWVMCHS